MAEERKDTPTIKKPLNSFFLYRKAIKDQICQENPGLTKSHEISKLAGELWRKEPEEVKNHYQMEAQLAFDGHKKAFPTYQWPSRNHPGAKKRLRATKKMMDARTSSTSPETSSPLLISRPPASNLASSSASTVVFTNDNLEQSWQHTGPLLTQAIYQPLPSQQGWPFLYQQQTQQPQPQHQPQYQQQHQHQQRSFYFQLPQ